MKLLFIILDGAGDKIDGITPFERADTEGLDELVKHAKCGLQYPIGEGVAPESDVAVFSLLGYNPYEHYTGRGPLEALGVGIRIKEGREVAFRANFATIDTESMRIRDRRCGRDLSQAEAEKLSESLNNIKLDPYDGYFHIRPTEMYRAAIVFGSSLGLSDKVTSTDPAYTRIEGISTSLEKYEPEVRRCSPLEESEEAIRTARLVNAFTEKAIRVLDSDPVNKERVKKGKLKANAIIMRQPGASLPKVKSINETFGLRFGSVTEMSGERGVAALLGIEAYPVPPFSGDITRDPESRVEGVDKLLERVDVVYIHLKGPDIPGHDGNFERKVEAIEFIDKFFIQRVLERWDLEEASYLVTSDHATPWRLKAHSGDPVPFMVASKRLKADGIEKFCERECSRGSLGVIPHGWLLMPKVLRMVFG